MANPSSLFKAMATGDPYSVKAFFTLGNNTLMSYASQPRIREALMTQDLIVGGAAGMPARKRAFCTRGRGNGRPVPVLRPWRLRIAAICSSG